MSSIEALYIFDEHNNPILEHIFTGRPLSAKSLLPQYLAHPAPRPSLIYLPNAHPPTIVHSILQDRLLFLCPTSTETEPLLVLEFLHKVADAFEDFVGSPLLASKIEGSYDVVAQLLGEMCDAGQVATTEPNALREVVEAPTWMGKLLGNVGLPSSSLAVGSSGSFSLQKPQNLLAMSTSGSAIPWRRSNVRHTSNEMYVDMVETLSVTLAPSGRPLSAFANGTIAFTAKVSGVPDLLLTLSAPGGKATIDKALDLPVFHPCVRLAHWQRHPGELSFIPPDGRFVLAGYEVDLLPPTSFSTKQPPNLNLPASVDVRTSLGANGSEFEVRLSLSTKFGSTSSSNANHGPSLSRSSGLSGRLGTSSPAFGSTSNHPHVEEIVVRVPIPAGVRNLNDIRPSRGEANYSPGDGSLEWRISTKDVTVMQNSSNSAVLRCAVLGQYGGEDEDEVANGFEITSDTVDYDDGAYQSAAIDAANGGGKIPQTQEQRNAKRIRQNATLMPSAATVSFAVKGWLASGIKVESLVINTKASRGLGAGVTPYKGVKYLTVSRQGVEIRC